MLEAERSHASRRKLFPRDQEEQHRGREYIRAIRNRCEEACSKFWSSLSPLGRDSRKIQLRIGAQTELPTLGRSSCEVSRDLELEEWHSCESQKLHLVQRQRREMRAHELLRALFSSFFCVQIEILDKLISLKRM